MGVAYLAECEVEHHLSIGIGPTSHIELFTATVESHIGGRDCMAERLKKEPWVTSLSLSQDVQVMFDEGARKSLAEVSDSGTCCLEGIEDRVLFQNQPR